MIQKMQSADELGEKGMALLRWLYQNLPGLSPPPSPPSLDKKGKGARGIVVDSMKLFVYFCCLKMREEGINNQNLYCSAFAHIFLAFFAELVESPQAMLSINCTLRSLRMWDERGTSVGCEAVRFALVRLQEENAVPSPTSISVNDSESILPTCCFASIFIHRIIVSGHKPLPLSSSSSSLGYPADWYWIMTSQWIESILEWFAAKTRRKNAPLTSNSSLVLGIEMLFSSLAKAVMCLGRQDLGRQAVLYAKKLLNSLDSALAVGFCTAKFEKRAFYTAATTLSSSSSPQSSSHNKYEEEAKAVIASNSHPTRMLCLDCSKGELMKSWKESPYACHEYWNALVNVIRCANRMRKSI